MREIKFRGIGLITEKFVYGYFIMFSDGSSYVLEHNDHDDTFNKITVYLKSIGQYTGLFDKNGVEIYEGDIIKTSRGDWGVIVYKAPFFEVTVSEDQSCMYSREWFDEIEVIGNIHEHESLLK